MTTINTTNAEKHATPRVQQVDAQSLSRWMNDGGAVLVDVREADEHAREHIPGAVLLPLSRFDPAQVPAADGKKIVLHCRSGHRSMQAAMRLVQAGRGDVHSLEGGLERWRSSGLPTQVNRRAPLPIMRQVQIAAGSLVVLGTLLGVIVSPWWLILSGFVGGGLIFAGASGFCGMANVLAFMPWNRKVPVCDASEAGCSPTE